MKMPWQRILIGVIVVLCPGCAPKRISTPSEYMSSSEYQSRPEVKDSLFKGDQAVLSNEDIEKILSVKIKLLLT